MRYARISNSAVSEVIELPDGITLQDALHPDLAALFVPCAADVAAGWTYDGADFAAPVGVALPSLAEIKTALKAVIDTAAETERLNYLTPGVGQAMTYNQKVAEAQAYKAASTPQATDYPILAAEVGITAATLAEVAAVVLATFAQWQQIGAAIEAIRLGAKRDVDAAENAAVARAVVDAIDWPSAQMQA